MGTWGFGPFENDDASAIVGGIASELTAELVSFVHRVKFGYAMHYNRARAAAVLLTTLAKAGLPVSLPEDATAPLIERTFGAYFAAVSSFKPEHQQAIEADVAEFVRVFADPDVIASPPVADEVAGALRAIGAEPAAWWWASGFGFDFADAWKHSDSPPRRIPQVALAAGVDAQTVLRAIADAVLREAQAITNSTLECRDDLLELLEALAGADETSAARRALTKRIHDASKAEGDARLKRLREQYANPSEPSEADEEDPLLGVLFQTAELTRMGESMATLGVVDPYWAGDFVEKLVRDARATDALAAVRAELDSAVVLAATQRADALGDEISIPLGTVRRTPTT